LRSFLDDILAFIGSESLTDEEFDVIDALDLDQTYTKDVYEALRATLEGRDNVSGQVKRLKVYFIARGADLSETNAIPTPQSNIFLGGGVEDPSFIPTGTTETEVGPPGPAGPAGADGADGPPGSQILVTSGVPDNGDGANGDFAIDSLTNDYYLKVAGVWVLQGQFFPSNLPSGGDTGQFLVKNSGTDFDAEWTNTLRIDSVSGGLIGETNLEPDGETGGFQVSRFSSNFRPLQDSPAQTWDLAFISANLDPDSSGFDFGTGGNALNALAFNLNHGGTSDIGNIAFLNQYFNLGNGTDPINAKGFAYAFGFGNVNAGVNINGNVQGYGFQPAFNAAATIDDSVGINAFYDFASLPIAVPSYTSIALGPQIASVINNRNYNSISANPQIDELEGNAGCFGFAWSPQIDLINSGSAQGLSMNPTVTLNKGYVAGLAVNMNNVTNYAGVQASLVAQDITFTFIQPGVFGNTISVEYLDTATAGNEVASLSGGDTISVAIESGVSTATQVLAAIQAVPSIISNVSVVITGTASDPQTAFAETPLAGGEDPGRKYAIDVVGDVNIQGGLAFTGGLSLAALSSFANYNVASSLGVASIDTLITAPNVAANATITGTDLLAVNTAMLLTIGDNASVTSSFLGYAALGLPAVLSMGAGSTIDLVEGAIFAVSLDAGATGGTVDELALCRSVAIPNGVTTVTKLKGYRFDLPFGDPGTTTWGYHNDVATAHNYFKRNVIVGDSETPTNDSVGIELNSTTKAIRWSNMTAAERDAMTPLQGMAIFVTDLVKFQGYDGTSWVNFH